MSKHRRCTKPRHHTWRYTQTIAGWVLAHCTNCTAVDLA